MILVRVIQRAELERNLDFVAQRCGIDSPRKIASLCSQLSRQDNLLRLLSTIWAKIRAFRFTGSGFELICATLELGNH
jgi:hypothetical protein